MRAPTATIERTEAHPGCTCSPRAMHSAWDIAPRAVGRHDPACPSPDTRGSADDAAQGAADASPDLWLG